MANGAILGQNYGYSTIPPKQEYVPTAAGWFRVAQATVTYDAYGPSALVSVQNIYSSGGQESLKALVTFSKFYPNIVILQDAVYTLQFFTQMRLNYNSSTNQIFLDVYYAPSNYNRTSVQLVNFPNYTCNVESLTIQAVDASPSGETTVLTTNVSGIFPVEIGGTGVSSVGGTDYTTTRFRGSQLVDSDTNPTINGTINWTYE